MQRLLAAGLLAALFLASPLHAFEEEDDVIVGTAENWDELLAQNEFVLVEFYAPWCGHCKRLAPEYARAAKTLKDDGLPLVKVDATVHKDLAQQFGVRGYPTIKLFRNGKPSDYNGGRQEADIVSWMRKKSGPPAKTIETVADLDAFAEANEGLYVVGVIGSGDEKAFLDAAAADENLAFAKTSSAEVAEKLGVAAGASAVVVVKPFDEKRNELELAGKTSEEIGEFVAGSATPLVQTFSKESSAKIFGSNIKVHFLFFTEPTESYHATALESFTELAQNVRGQAMVVNVPAAESKVMDYFGLTEADLPALYIADMRSEGGMKKFKYEQGSDWSGLSTFAAAFFDGSLKPSLKSEEPEEGDLEGPVWTLKGKNFEDVALKSQKDVLVEFYAPWCGHCKKLKPVYDELGEAFVDNENIVIAAMDATANEVDVEGVNVRGFPTLVFFKADGSAPMTYDGGRTLDELKSFVSANAVHAAGASDEL